MKKMIAAIAIAGLGASLAVGANAQTIGTVGSNPAGSYVINVAETTALTGTPGSAGAYTYSYLLTLDTAASQANTNVFNLGFGFPKPNEFDLGSESATGPFAGAALNESTSGFAFTNTVAGQGLNSSTPTTTISYTSPLPPASVVGITPTADGIPNGAGAGANFTGPGTAVPEVSSFALIGLGLLPLGLVARRRILKNN